MKGGIDIDELQLDYLIVRTALEELTYAVSEGANIGKYLLNARVALQWSRTLTELGENCEGCED